MRRQDNEIDLVGGREPDDLLCSVSIDNFLDHLRVCFWQLLCCRRHDPLSVLFQLLIKGLRLFGFQTTNRLDDVKQNDASGSGRGEVERQIKRVGRALGQVCRNKYSLEPGRVTNLGWRTSQLRPSERPSCSMVQFVTAHSKTICQSGPNNVDEDVKIAGTIPLLRLLRE